jgi:hypothetical protein
VAQVDPDDDKITRFVLWHNTFDPMRNERRHVVLAAYDTEAAFKAALSPLYEDLLRRRETGIAHPTEHYGGELRYPGHEERRQQAKYAKWAFRGMAAATRRSCLS